MKIIALDCNMTPNKETFENEEATPYLIALAGLMIVTGVYRLFEKNDVYQLLKRIQLCFPEQNCIDNFFTNELLFCFQYKYVQYQFKYKHLKKLIGVEIINVQKKTITYNDWISEIESCVVRYNSFALNGLLSGLILEDLRHQLVINKEDKVYSRVLKQRELCLSNENKYKAKFLAKTITNEFSSFVQLKDAEIQRRSVTHSAT